MRIFAFALCLLAAASLGSAQESGTKKRAGGFTATTPKPTAKKKPAVESTTKKKASTPKPEATPSPKAKRPAGDEPEGKAEAKKSTPSAKNYDAESEGAKPVEKERAPAATIEPEEIAEFSAQPPKIQALITAALELTKLNLTYTYGSADPAQGGMDCSGTMYHLLRSQGFSDVARDSSGQYVWARKAGPFFAVVSKSAESFEFRDLQPGDLLFWTGTYETGREIPISHVMLYLGTEKKTRKRIMFGASDGRSYNGVQRWGVSVFDFKMPRVDPANPEKAKVDFVGYGKIPGLRDSAPVTAQNVPEEAEPSATPAPKKKAPTASTSSGAAKKPTTSKKSSKR